MQNRKTPTSANANLFVALRAGFPQDLDGVAVETESIKMGNATNYMPIPAKYGDVKTSGLTAEIKKGDAAPLAFELKSK